MHHLPPLKKRVLTIFTLLDFPYIFSPFVVLIIYFHDGLDDGARILARFLVWFFFFWFGWGGGGVLKLWFSSIPFKPPFSAIS